METNLEKHFSTLKLTLEQIHCVKIESNFNEKLMEIIKNDSKLVYTVFSEIYQVIEKILELVKESKIASSDKKRKHDNEPNKDLSSEHHTTFNPESSINQKKIKRNSSLVQIQADKAEVDRRIAAFMEKKQTEVDDLNIREFCNLLHTEPKKDSCSSCARTDAVFVPRVDSKSHVKVSRVLNQYGPQTRLLQPSPTKGCVFGNLVKQEPVMGTRTDMKLYKEKVPFGLCERINNLEGHIGMDTSNEKNVFKRIKLLEERVLHLESLSPEYFNFMCDINNRHKFEKTRMKKSDYKYSKQIMNVQEIEDKISTLKQKLVTKDIKSEPS